MGRKRKKSFPTQKFSRENIHKYTEGKEKEKEDESFVTYFYDKPGASPGTLRIDETAHPPTIILINYNEAQETRVELKTPQESEAYINNSSITWLDVQDLGSEEVLRSIGQLFNLHPLILEDVVNVPQRPKVEEYEDQLIIITQMVRLDETKEKNFVREQVSFIVRENCLITFQEESKHDAFDPVRKRIKTGKGTIRKNGTDYLTYALIDAIIDGFYPVLEAFGEELEDLEEEVVEKPTRRTLERIHYLKRELLEMRRLIWPMRDAINSLIRDENKLIGKEVRIYLRDCYDHAVQILDMVETYRELTYSMMDVYVSSVGNRMNDIMKFLTVMSTIFIPLTFLAGVYGMNFKTENSPFNMPELSWYWGYPAFWTLIIITAGGLIFYFWRKGWFEDFSSLKDDTNSAKKQS